MLLNPNTISLPHPLPILNTSCAFGKMNFFAIRRLLFDRYWLWGLGNDLFFFSEVELGHT